MKCLIDVRIGTRVKLSKARLRAQCLPTDALTSYVRVSIDDQIAGNAFACRWPYEGKTVCWVTQLVVHSDFRERGLAAYLLNLLRQDGDVIYGLMSSHPAACLAAAKAFGSQSQIILLCCDLDADISIGGINMVALPFMQDNAEAIMKCSPIRYVRDAELRGSLYDCKDSSGGISSVNTEFHVDHAQALEALAWVRESQEWPLGELLEGHEFLLILEVRRRDRSRSSSRGSRLDIAEDSAQGTMKCK